MDLVGIKIMAGQRYDGNQLMDLVGIKIMAGQRCGGT